MLMNSIVFTDTEVDAKSNKLQTENDLIKILNTPIKNPNSFQTMIYYIIIR